MIHLSKTSKLGCLSWSLQAGDTCPGSKDKAGNWVPACAGCYARSGNYRFDNVKTPRLENAQDWKRNEWVDDMVAALQGSRYFRWFDSGDMYTLQLAEKILAVMEATPWCSHWLPTRMQKFPKFHNVITRMEALPNVKVRFSSDSVVGEYTDGLHGSVIIPTADYAVDTNVKVCGAYQREGKCGTCRACWSKSVAVVAYPAHGKAMGKVIKSQLVTGA